MFATASTAKRSPLYKMSFLVALTLCLTLQACASSDDGESKNAVQGNTKTSSQLPSTPASTDEPQIPMTWHGKGASSDGTSGITAGNDEVLHLELDASGTATLKLADETHNGTWEYYPALDDTTKKGGQVTGICVNLGAAKFIGKTNGSACVLLMEKDPDFILLFGSTPEGSLADLDLDLSSSSDSSSGANESGSSRPGDSLLYSPERSTEPSASVGERNALQTAKSYLDRVGGFSEKKLSDQLEYEGYTDEEIEYAIKHCGADWYEQAAQSAQSYLSLDIGFSRTKLLDQLKYEGFTTSQAQYGVESVGL